MESGKADNPLNLALSTPEAMREKSIDLNTGFQEQTRRWELIVKYHGDLEELAGQLGFEAVPLLNSYAVITIDEGRIPALLASEQLEFAEKPNRLYFELEKAVPASCLPVRVNDFALSGAGTLVGIIDSGIDYAHPDFRNEDGSTRIALLWDQTIPNGIFTEEQINEALRARSLPERLRLVPSTDVSGHGTAVAGIAAGNGRASGGRYRGVAYDSRLIVVRLGSSVGNSFPRTTNLMTAMDFLAREALKRGLPMAVNISFGNNYGAHDGSSLVEQYLTAVSGFWKISIVTGTGNEGAARGHTAGRLTAGGGPQTIEFSVGPGERSLSLQLWKNYSDRFGLEIIAPSGASFLVQEPVSAAGERIRRTVLSDTEVLVYLGEPKPYTVNQEIYMEFLPAESRMNSGIWRIVLTPLSVTDGEYRLWLPAQEALEPSTGFLQPVESTTLTIPSAASGVISVGAYDSFRDSYAYFSGRGYAVGTRNSKPDLAAPGVDIFTTSPGGGYSLHTGTSMAAPFVTGAAALLMQWGIVQGRDPYLYGEKIKAYLKSGARRLPGFSEYPNALVGDYAIIVPS
ncbi:MAG: S8 family serine peptidase [Lachnospiraceae bacterium]|nr:S8 family serine peptidase [Lachnospiraceae bacterium]